MSHGGLFPSKYQFFVVITVCAKSLQSCLTHCNPMDCTPPGSSVHGILQARILESVAIPFSRGSSQSRDQTRSPALQADSLPFEPPGKIFPTVWQKETKNELSKHIPKETYRMQALSVPSKGSQIMDWKEHHAGKYRKTIRQSRSIPLTPTRHKLSST